MAAIQSLLPWGDIRPWQDHGSITEQFKCQVLHRNQNLSLPEYVKRLCSPPATALFAPHTQLSQSHIGAALSNTTPV